MIDDRLVELVSRYVDGDLDAEASARLEAKAAADHEVAELIASFGGLRQSVRDLAGGMAPPAELDAVIEPLSRAPAAPRRRVRPVYRWLGAAAAVVLGVSVVLEVARRHPGPTLEGTRPKAQVTTPDEGVFELAPLPTAAPSQGRPLGATDRLLRQRVTPPPAPEPSPLEVIGPLDDATGSARPEDEAPAIGGAAGATDDEDRSGTSDEAVEQARRGRAATGPVEEIAPDSASNASAKAGRAAPSADAEGAQADQVAAIADPGEAARRASLEVDGVEMWSGWLTGCSSGRRSVVLEVRGGAVVGAKPRLPTDEVWRRAPCRLEGLLGSAVDGHPDGRLVAELVVRTRH